jgi:hypothetical protein
MQRFGVPVSGALDSVSLRIANAVVGNADGTAGLEMFYQGPTLQIEAESVRVAPALPCSPIRGGPPTWHRAPSPAGCPEVHW